MKEDIYVISLGGSLIIPEEIDVDFLKSFKQLIITQIEKGKKFVIITGGGKVTRKYNDAAKVLSSPDNDDLDWIGIASLKLNAEFIRVIFRDYTNRTIVTDLAEPFIFEKSIVIGSAYRPGWSTDYNAVLAGHTIGAHKVINLSNTDYVYDADPRTHPDAKKIETISWADYRKLIPTEWNPGLNSPFDPIASAFAEREKITVITMNGKNIDNLEKALNGEPFLGTTIE
jgi:uridylate kinase